ncbi:hypothetical protein F3N42_00845 [Marinihelvus fidelis]|uniref:PNPLA domain-containing protein n=1 Tax=Marinihelvus fidelis TaxID=2613842 RepID=A0A5N0TI28_9GAMM|nr:patatin-like phospholipase family protein [Marinihelvus fidelis]KAA9134124.1 hypothetical protein F3N42_00845 [Marinihelvus fidelis]
MNNKKTSPGHPQHLDFETDVFPEELEVLRDRRRQEGLDDSTLDGPPNPDLGLVGLAISGGGIRSATFSLGVIQGLARNGLLKHVDYLSTVSGGGYTGSCISALLNDPENRPDNDRFPLRYTQKSSEPPAMTHLRNFANYLNPVGLLPLLRLPNLMLRGILLNLFVFLPFIMAAVFVTEAAYELGPNWDMLPRLVAPLVMLFVLLALAFPFLIRLLGKSFDWNRRNVFELLLTIPLLLAGLVLLAIPVLHVTRLAIEHSTDQFWYWFTHLPPDKVWQFMTVVGGVIVLFMLAGKASENVGRIFGKLLLWLVGLIGPVIVYLIFLGLCLWQIDSPFLPVGSAKGLNDAVACTEPCLAGGDSTGSHGDDPLDSDDTLYELLFEREPGPATATELRNALAGRGLQMGENAVARCQSGNCDTAPDPMFWREDRRVWVINLDPSQLAECPPYQGHAAAGQRGSRHQCVYFTRASAASLRIHGPLLHLFDGAEDWWFVGVFIALLLINRFMLDINITSPHGFYRDRLSKAFLFRVQPDGETTPEDNLKLSALNAPGTAAPYHLVNVAMNLQGSHAADLRGRECDFFTFSRNFCGGVRTGWAPTKEMERYDRHLDLATAMAISGAAAAPNMGTTTNRALVFIMTLLNIRLGYWLPNPSAVNRDMAFKRFRLGSAKPTLIWKEALGRLDEKGTHINVSDGGHIENLAIYQLLRRRCKFILAIDGECDPAMEFSGLTTLMRYARIDMGVDISINLDPLRKTPDGLSEKHAALGHIRYADGSTGQLLYIKLSVSGDEPEYVHSYRCKHPLFPHEPTSDQFFTEAQFEAYRALGAHACEGLLADVEALGGFARLRDDPRDSTSEA